MNYKEEAERLGDLEQKVDDLETLIGGIEITLENELHIIRKRVEAVEAAILVGRRNKDQISPDQRYIDTITCEDEKMRLLLNRGFFYIEHNNRWVIPADWPDVMADGSHLTTEEAWEEYKKLS
jgi:hypothetical protein